MYPNYKLLHEQVHRKVFKMATPPYTPTPKTPETRGKGALAVNPKFELTAADGTTELPLETSLVLLATDDDYQRRPARRDCQPRERSAS